MVDVLLVSLPSYWGREYVYVENYWMIAIAQFLSSYGYTVSTIDASLKQYKLIDVQKSVFQIKVILELFHEQATTQSIQFLIEAMRSGDVQVAPTALIAGKTLDLHLVQIQSILRTLFFKIFLPYYKKIIAYENNKKYEMRIGNSQQYSIIPKIEKEVNMLSQSLNELIFSILEELLSYMTLNEYETGDIIIAILKKYEDRITEVGGYIDANLFNSCRIQ